MTTPAIPAEVRERITAAAEELYQQAGRDSLPTVDQVRRAARADMNATSTVMREWRRQQTAQAAPVAVTVPEAVAQASSAALAAIWQQAQELANDSLRAAQAGWEGERAELDAMRQELADAYEAQAAELDQVRSAEAAAEQAHQEQHRQDAAELAELRQRLAAAEARNEAAERLAGELRTECTNAQQVAGEARERAATLAGRLEAVEAQNAALMERLSPEKKR